MGRREIEFRDIEIIRCVFLKKKKKEIIRCVLLISTRKKVTTNFKYYFLLCFIHFYIPEMWNMCLFDRQATC